MKFLILHLQQQPINSSLLKNIKILECKNMYWNAGMTLLSSHEQQNQNYGDCQNHRVSFFEVAVVVEDSCQTAWAFL